MTHFRSRFALAMLSAALPLLSACSDALVYGESTNFSLASLKVNDNVAQPLSVNFALDRSVAALVPPMGDGDEAANMVASFKLDDDSDSFFGTKTITTEFVSGRAAEVMATRNPAQALRILAASEFTEDRYSRCIDAWMEADESLRDQRIEILNTWWRESGHEDYAEYMRHTQEYAPERKQFVESKNIPCA